MSSDPNNATGDPAASATKDPYRSEKTAVDLAWAEWEIVQKKIDNVSGFPFQVKAWSVSLSAGLFVLLSRNLELPKGTLLIILVLPIAFRAVEANAEHFRRKLSARALTLENVIRELQPVRDLLPPDFSSRLRRELGQLPGIGLYVLRATKSLQSRRVSFQTPPRAHPPTWGFDNYKLCWEKYVAAHADWIFFAIHMIVLAAIIVVFEMRRTDPGIEHPKQQIDSQIQPSGEATNKTR